MSNPYENDKSVIYHEFKEEKKSTKREEYINWDQYFMAIAQISALRSKDPATQVGCCIVDKDNKILSLGYNGFPRGCSDDEFPWCKDQEEAINNKYYYVVHSELNAILNYKGGSLEGSTIYVTLFPCNECAKAIIQSGIKKVIFMKDSDHSIYIASKRMLKSAGVELVEYEPSGKECIIKF